MLLTIHQAGRLLGIKPRSVGWQCQRGRISAIKVKTRYGPSWRITREAVDEYEDTRQEQEHFGYVTALWCPECCRFYRAGKDSTPCPDYGRNRNDYNLVEMPEEYLS